MNTWLTSDTHFLQEAILDFIDSSTKELLRPGFDSIEHHDEYIIEMWNSVIAPNDTVYHLGDVCYIPEQHNYPQIHNRLNGTKHLIVGNHDDIRYHANLDWVSVNMWVELHEENILLTHTPQDQFALLRGKPGASFKDWQPSYRLNVHGHIHQNPEPTHRHRCVCLEHTEYKPVNLDTYVKDPYHV